MSVLKLQTVDNRLIKQNNTVFSSGSVGVDSIQINLDGTWNFNNAEYFLCCESLENSTEGKTTLTRNGDVLSCEVPIFVTANPAEWEIGIYAEQNARRIKTSTLVNITVVQGAKTEASDPYEPIRAEAYEQGKAEGYEEGNILTKQIISYYESLPSYPTIKGGSELFYKGNADNLLDLPYMNTEKLAWEVNTGILIGNYIRTIGLDVSSVFWSGNKCSLFTGAKSLEKCIVTGIQKAFDEGRQLCGYGLEDCWRNCTNLREVYTDGIAPLKNSNSQYIFNNAFSGCTKLKIIGGFNKETRAIDDADKGAIDFNKCTNAIFMFSQCTMLEEVRFKPFSLSLALFMDDCAKLSKESVMSLINALSLARTSTIHLNAVVKEEMDGNGDEGWWCAFDITTGLYHITDPETDPTAMAFRTAIAAKGWVLA